jgi:hypothetical protein
MKTLMKPLTVAAMSVALLAPANAAFVCTVTDPTDTPLNVRSQPNGKILGALHNDTKVLVTEKTKDWKWAKIIPIDMDKTGKTGWVFYDYLDCTL